MGFGIFSIHKMAVVGAHQLHLIRFSQFQQHFVHSHLQGISFAVGPLRRVFHFMTLQLQIEVIAKDTFEPFHTAPGCLKVISNDVFWYLASEACRTDYETLMIFLQLRVVGTGPHVESVGPRVTDQFNQIVVTFLILGQYHQMPTRLVFTAFPMRHTAPGYIHFTTENRFETQCAASQFHFFITCREQLLLTFSHVRHFLFFLRVWLITSVCNGCTVCLQLFQVVFGRALDVIHIIEVLLYTHHIAMIGNGHAAHAVLDSLVHQALHAALSVEYRILCMNV